MVLFKAFFAGFLLSMVEIAAPALAAEPPAGTKSAPAIGTQEARVELIAAAPELAGLRVRLQPGWKFYWRHPGEGGLPPSFDWTQSQNLDGTEVLWPAPRRLSIAGADVFGYANEVVLPIRLKRQDATAPLALKLALSFGICKEVCILREDLLQATLPPAASFQSNATALAQVSRALLQVPLAPEASGLAIALEHLDAQQLALAIRSPVPLNAPDLFIEAADQAYFGRPAWQMAPDRLSARARLPRQGEGAPGPGQLRVTFVDGTRATEAQLSIVP